MWAGSAERLGLLKGWAKLGLLKGEAEPRWIQLGFAQPFSRRGIQLGFASLFSRGVHALR